MSVFRKGTRAGALATAALAVMAWSPGASAQVELSNPFDKDAQSPLAPLGTAFAYQGRLTDGGAPYNGLADLVFKLFDSSAGGIQIGSDNILSGHTVDNGLFTAVLDFGAGAFTANERWLEITVNGTPLAPRQLVHPGPIAQYAMSVDGASVMNLNANYISTGVLPDARLSGAYTNPLTFSNTGNAYTGTSINIDSNGFVTDNGRIGINKATSNWNLDIDSTNTAGLGIKLARGGGTRFLIGNSAAAVNSKWWGIDSGGPVLNFFAVTDNEVSVSATPLALQRNGDVNIQSVLHLGTDLNLQGTTGGYAEFHQSDGDLGVVIDGNNGQIQTYGTDGLVNARIWDGSWGELDLWDGSPGNDQTVELSATNDSGGQLTLWTNDRSAVGAFLAADRTTYGGGQLLLRESDGSVAFELNATDAFSTGSDLFGYNSAGDLVFDLDTGITTPYLALYDGSGSTVTNAMSFSTSTTSGGVITIRDSAGNPTITLDGDVAGDGRVTTQEIAITGGSDLSEQFDVAQPESGGLEPGLVVCIDPDRIGKLLVSTKAYDRTVAGIISGAGGIEPGMMMGQVGTEADGQHPIALTGRVYVYCDTSNGPIVPGDLLTTSDTPGHAMKVVDHDRAQGAIIGKAMSRLDAEEGSGLVLVLVSLQ